MNAHGAPTTPRLDALFSRLRGALLRLVVAYGVGTVVAATGAWLLFMYWADRLLHLPPAIRIVHVAVLVGLPVILAVRTFLRPLARVPDRTGLALLLGRAHPETADVLVSAVQLGPRVDDAARELIDRIVERAETTAGALGTDRVVDARVPLRRLAAGAAAAATVMATLAIEPTMSAIFFARMLGGQTSWPQRTHLVIEVPAVGDRVRVEAGPEVIRVLAARGSDVPVHVRAEGDVPREVLLHFAGGHETALASGGTPLFRTLLRSVQEGLAFHVTGGDDVGGLPRVEIEVLQPPDVAGVAWSVHPPAYSGLEDSLVQGPEVQVLAGSTVRVHVLPDPPDATGVARLFPEDREVALEPAPFPTGSADDHEAPGLTLEIEAEASMRIRFDLVDARGLPNPDPGLFGLTVVEDRRPEVLLLAPARAELDAVAGGAVPLRARVEDDFGIASITWDVRAEARPDDALVSGELESRPIDAPEDTFGRRGRDVRIARTRLEVDELGAGQPLVEGQVVLLQVFAVDNREPQGSESPSVPVRLRVTSGDEYLRRLQDGLARASDQASRLYDLGARELANARLALEAADGGDAPDAAAVRPDDLTALVHGARRVQGDARALGREVAGLTEGLLYNRIDSRATALMETLDAALSEATERSFRPEPWTDLARRYEAGELGQADVAGTLVRIVGLALAVSEEHAAEFADAVAEAHATVAAASVRDALERAVAAQTRAQEVLDELLIKLGEWDNFQSVLTLTRDILNRQKNLNQRTRKHAEDH